MKKKLQNQTHLPMAHKNCIATLSRPRQRRRRRRRRRSLQLLNLPETNKGTIQISKHNQNFQNPNFPIKKKIHNCKNPRSRWNGDLEEGGGGGGGVAGGGGV